jgi:peptidoglycan/LPS O-acetylase OafA/YrhL
MKHIPALDGLRGLACLAVVGFHAFGTVFRGGQLGVDVFFVLSGFLITNILLQDLDTYGAIRFKHFYIRRARRLLPALVGTVTLAGIIWLIFGGRGVFSNCALAALGYYSNWVICYYGYTSMGSLQHTWSLAVEEQFYLIWPAMLLLLVRVCGRDKTLLTRTILGLAGCFVALRFVLGSVGSPLALYPSTLVRMDALLIGCACACLYKQTAAFWSGRRGGLVSIACGAALIASSLSYNSLSFSGTAGLVRTLVALYTAAVILRLVSGVGCRILEHPWLVAIGKRSYGIYLYPVVLGYAFPSVAFPGRGLAISLAGIAVAWASFNYLESPFLRQSASSLEVAQPAPPEPVFQAKLASVEKPTSGFPGLLPS